MLNVNSNWKWYFLFFHFSLRTVLSSCLSSWIYTATPAPPGSSYICSSSRHVISNKLHNSDLWNSINTLYTLFLLSNYLLIFSIIFHSLSSSVFLVMLWSTFISTVSSNCLCFNVVGLVSDVYDITDLAEALYILDFSLPLCICSSTKCHSDLLLSYLLLLYATILHLKTTMSWQFYTYISDYHYLHNNFSINYNLTRFFGYCHTLSRDHYVKIFINKLRPHNNLCRSFLFSANSIHIISVTYNFNFLATHGIFSPFH